MGSRSSAAGRPRGGEGIQALRQARARLGTGALSLAALGGAVAIAASSRGPIGEAAAALGGAGLLLLAVALAARRPQLVPWAIAAAGAAYLATREGHPTVDGRAALVGGALLLAAELGFWSAGDNPRIPQERALVARRAAAIGALCLVAVLVDFLLLAAAAVSAASSTVLAAAGVVAAVAAVAVVLRLLRRRSASPTRSPSARWPRSPRR